METRVAKFLALPTKVTHGLKVTVGNGTVLDCLNMCLHTTVSFQGCTFDVDLHVLPISGADIVLGIQWLKRLGPLIMDYDTMTMQFIKHGELVRFRADGPTKPVDASALQVKRFLQTNVASAFFHISITETKSLSINPTPHQHILEIASLVTTYHTIFQTPTQLPPSRNITHKIHLLPNSNPVNVRPYRYPHFQKGEIEQQVDEILSSGMIQLSHNPFSSPILLVKKKDGSWHFCVDYRVLNSITIKGSLSNADH